MIGVEYASYCFRPQGKHESEMERIKGARDLLGVDYVALKAIQEELQAFLDSYGYVGIDTPLLEETRLFLRKSGGELASKLYSFTDPGGREVSLRPEFTASVIRVYIEKESELPLPVRWQYTGPVFRYEQPEVSDYRQFTQQGVELIGSAGPLADVETLTLACRGIQKLGIEGSRLVLGHVGVILGLLNGLGLSDRIKMFLANSMGELSKGVEATHHIAEQIERYGLLAGADNRQRLGAFLTALDEKEAKAIVQELLMGATESVGSRDTDEIVSRFLRKLKEAAEPEGVERGLTLCGRLSQIRGEPKVAIMEVRRLAQEYGLDPAPLDEPANLVALLAESELGSTEIVADFGLTRELAYYTGMVFEIEHKLLSGGPPLCGGGRYDGLVRALGGSKDVPSLGFAYTLERLEQAQAIGGRATVRDEMSSQVLVAPINSGAYTGALRLAESLRERGQRVEMGVDQRTLQENMDYAKRCGIAEVILVREDGQADTYKVLGKGGR